MARTPKKPTPKTDDGPFVETGTDDTVRHDPVHSHVEPTDNDQDGSPQPHETAPEPVNESWGDRQARIARERERDLANGKRLPPSNGLTSPSDRDENNMPNPQTVDR